MFSMNNRLPDLLLPSVAISTKALVVESSLADKAQELIVQAGLDDKQLLLVCDVRTYAALGSRVMQELASLKPQLLILEGTPHADDATVGKLRLYNADALIAVGSGVISDICKYASFLDHKPYAVFPTAPSMNGYLSANASITVKGHKQSLAAHLPCGIFCDLGVLSAAPRRLILSGLGDALCRSTAQADWLMSHLVLDTPYTSQPFDLLKPYEEELLAHADKLATHDIRITELLMMTLLISGLGMVIAGGSYPASQGEHLIAHTMEMKHGGQLPETYHGEQIGVTTLTMAHIQETLLSERLCLRKQADWQKTITAYFGAALSDSVMEASYSKYLLQERVDAINDRLATQDKEIRDALRNIMRPTAYLREVLVRAGACGTPSALGWNEQDYTRAVRHARFIRNRFTFLDFQ